ncbi:uncharacterized protein N7459_002827 [Penicillium hispanicum]|uniref:uncharacterized protein n=1 Tax=Penicillium hispanicum TaxID=1080232 RepID=UPI00254079C5|nr:uncharacterized protein N7459_002827 [Penicillium hispanicum]KAJ5587062.1 hypothetical protein N7459_002827 [Penicillium hispanicum]
MNAFVLNSSMCDGTLQDAKIAPITQPAYSGLRLESTLLRNDLLDHINLHNTTPDPFKPVTHGQFRFTKLNIIDNGQAIHALNPRYASEGKQAVYPCISDLLAPSRLSNNEANIVRPPAQAGACEFIQISPQINQPAHLNAAFMIHDIRHDTDPNNYSYWRPVTEWENPVWGWMVLNYADYGLQVFLPDGTFYREVRLSSPTAPKKTTISAKWLPFEPPENLPDTRQLDRLISRFTEPD